MFYWKSLKQTHVHSLVITTVKRLGLCILLCFPKFWWTHRLCLWFQAPDTSLMSNINIGPGPVHVLHRGCCHHHSFLDFKMCATSVVQQKSTFLFIASFQSCWLLICTIFKQCHQSRWLPSVNDIKTITHLDSSLKSFNLLNPKTIPIYKLSLCG